MGASGDMRRYNVRGSDMRSNRCGRHDACNPMFALSAFGEARLELGHCVLGLFLLSFLFQDHRARIVGEHRRAAASVRAHSSIASIPHFHFNLCDCPVCIGVHLWPN